ncbi:MAG: hypothetical protein R3B13_19255 [Polyangiaceae bacterium]
MRRYVWVALSLLGCSSGGSSGGGGGGIQGGPPLPCEAGDLDLSTLAAPGSRGVGSPGSLPLSEPVQVLGQTGVQSAPVALCVPDDAVSMILFPDPARDAIPSSYVASGYGEQVDLSSEDALIHFISPDVMLPRSPELPLQPGRHLFRIADQTNAPVSPVIALRRGTVSGQADFALNLKFVQGAFQTDAELTAVLQAATLFDQIYAQVGVVAATGGVGTIDDQSLAVLPDSDLYKLPTAQATSLPDLPLVPDAVDIYFVRELVSQDAAGALLGKAMGIPGAPGVPNKQGVAISIDAHREGGQLLPEAPWVTIAHELGHWFGLRHVSERTGRTFDHAADTPECHSNRDANQDGLVDNLECAGAGADNLMFWTYNFQNPPTKISPGQGFVLRSSFVMEAR